MVSNDFTGLLEKLMADGGADQAVVNEIFKSKSHIKQQSNLIHKYNGATSSGKSNRNLVMIDFPSIYLNRLEEITFPKWYTSCFMSECSNSSVWGHYGANHTGMCLVFGSETINGKSYINLTGVTGWGSSGLTYGKKTLEFIPVDYRKGFCEI